MCDVNKQVSNTFKRALKRSIFSCGIFNERWSQNVMWFKNLNLLLYRLIIITAVRVEFDELLNTVLSKIRFNTFFNDTSERSAHIEILMCGTALWIPLRSYKPSLSLLDFVRHSLLRVFHISNSLWMRYLCMIENDRLFARPILRILYRACNYSTITFIKSLASGQRFGVYVTRVAKSSASISISFCNQRGWVASIGCPFLYVAAIITWEVGGAVWIWSAIVARNGATVRDAVAHFWGESCTFLDSWWDLQWRTSRKITGTVWN
jgi:hypothetical protein